MAPNTAAHLDDMELWRARGNEAAAPSHAAGADAADDAVPRLRARRDELQRQLERLGAPSQSEGPRWDGDPADETQALHHRHNMAAMRAILLEELRQVEHVLERAIRGLYGICEDCGAAIPPRRLH